jgi:hypothetical protein
MFMVIACTTTTATLLFTQKGYANLLSLEGYHFLAGIEHTAIVFPVLWQHGINKDPLYGGLKV